MPRFLAKFKKFGKMVRAAARRSPTFRYSVFVILGAVGAVILAVWFLKLVLVNFFYLAFPLSPSVSPPSPPAEHNGIQFIFTELFSGSGWKNELRTDVYHDLEVSAISAPPAYDWQRIYSLPLGVSVLAAARGGNTILLLGKKGELYILDRRGAPVELPRFIPEVMDGWDGRGWLDFDESSGKWAVVFIEENRSAGGFGERRGKIYTFSWRGAFRLEGEADISAVLGRIYPPSGNDETSTAQLVCEERRCFWAAGRAIFSFSVDRPADLVEMVAWEGMLRPNDIAVYLGKLPGGLLLAVVEKTESKEAKYTSRFYVWSSREGGPRRLGEKIFVSDYPGAIRFGYDKENGKLLAVYSAYLGAAYVFDFASAAPPTALSPAAGRDYSRSLNARVLGGNEVGKRSALLEVMSVDGDWWLWSSSDSPGVRLLKISANGAGVDLTRELASEAEKIFLIPDATPRSLLAVLERGGAVDVYRLVDRGYLFKDGYYTWESSRINRNDGNITSARISAYSGGGNISFYLSNNGGADWVPAKAAERVVFSGVGGDLRWRAELYPSGGVYQSPWLNSVTVEYWQGGGGGE